MARDADEADAPASTVGPAALAEREARVALLAASGLRNREIGARLGLSEKTVEWNLSRVYRKLRLRSRTELAVRFSAGGSPWAAERRK